MTTLFHIHDPMCSWCWGYRRTWDQIRARLNPAISIENVVGGLAPDSDEPMPLELQQTIAGYWKDVAEATGAEFNFDFWRRCRPRRSTYPACRAVLAALLQDAEQEMIEAIQQAYYLRAMNPSDNEVLISLASELNLDVAKFERDLADSRVESALQQAFALRKSLGVYSFPSLVLQVAGQNHPLEIHYCEYQPTLDQIARLLPSAEATALSRF
ncbi:DsbA family protein [Seongchinamella unica]|uniref:DsbA family protein n=2 Tax=Seongchinamella unica TaxID=2547392 RepID=A0A4R5LTG2_9GAMM|nr:DsbA family protein [Seongchinamella unica]